MLNPTLPINDLRARLAAAGRIQIGEFLQPRHADALERCLREQVPWTLAYRGDGKSQTLSHERYRDLSAEERWRLDQTVLAEAQRGFAFAYESFMMITAYLEKRAPELLLHRMVEYLNSAPFLKFARAVTGESRIVKSDAQATCYRAGHFLKYHDDFEQDQGRLYAFVLNLTRRWQADWGGLLQFLDADGSVSATLMPRYNSLTLFRVPAPHCVSMVAPFATGARYAITGWFRS